MDCHGSTHTELQIENAQVVMMGAERRSMVMTEEEKKLTAYHEAGHAIVTLNEKAAYPIHKATIIPRGRALGMVMKVPERDEVSQTREQLHAQMAIAMGGRVAEEIIFGDDKVTTGAASDIEQATKRARAMVMRAGLSKELGPILYGENEEEVFLGRSVARQQNMSEETAKKVDSEIKRFAKLVSFDSVYLIAANDLGSSCDPQFPCPSTKGYLNEKFCAIRTIAS